VWEDVGDLLVSTVLGPQQDGQSLPGVFSHQFTAATSTLLDPQCKTTSMHAETHMHARMHTCKDAHTHIQSL